MSSSSKLGFLYSAFRLWWVRAAIIYFIGVCALMALIGTPGSLIRSLF